MRQGRRTKNKWFSYVVTAYGAIVILGAGVFWIYSAHAHHASTTPHRNQTLDMNQSPFTVSTHPTVNAMRASLQALSTDIVSWKLSASDAEKDTAKAFHLYYSSTGLASHGNTPDGAIWTKIHYNLAAADAAAKNHNFTLMQGYWQAIEHEVASVHVPK